MIELKRIYSPKIILLFVVMALLNFVLFMLSCDENKVITLSEEELGEYISSYHEFIDRTIKQSESLSMLNIYGGGFGSKNISKTAEDYGKLSEIVPSYGENRGIVVFSDYHLTDLFLVAFLIIISTQLLAERKNGLVALVRSTAGGRARPYFSRVGAILFASFLAAFCLYGGNILGIEISFGAVEMNRPIQSVPEFVLCPYKISIGEYFTAVIGMKALACLTAAMIFFTLISLLGTAGAYLFGGLVLLLELLAYMLIPQVSFFNFLKYINIFAAVKDDDYFRVYQNLNIFGNPVPILSASLSACAVIAVLCFLVGIYIHEKMYVSREHFAQHLYMKIKMLAERHGICRSIFGWEGYKLIIRQFGGIIIIAVFTAALSQTLKYGYFYPVDPYAIVWYAKYEEVISEEMLSGMKQEKTKLEESMEISRKLLEDMAERGELNTPAYSALEQRLQEAEDQYNALLPIIENVRDGADYTHRTGRTIMLIKPYSYDLLIKRDIKTVKRNSIFILIGIIAAISGVYSFERQNHMDIMFRSSYRGRFTVNVVKPIWVIVISAVLTVSVHMIQLYIIYSDMGLNNIDVPIQSLMFMRGFKPYISIRQYIILLFAVRMIVSCIVGLICSAISRLCGDTAASLGISAFTAAIFALAPEIIGLESAGLIYWIGGEILM